MRGRHRNPAVRVLVTLLLAVPVLISGLTLPAGAPSARADNLQDRIRQSQQRQAELRRAMERQQDLLAQLREDEGLAESALSSSADRLDEINVDQAALREEIGAASDALHRVEARRDALVGELRNLDFTLELLDTEIVQSEQDLEARRQQLGRRIADAYRTGQTSLLEQILDAGSFADVLTGMDAFLRFGNQDAELAAQIQADQAELDSLRRLMVATRYNTDQLRIETVTVEQQLRVEQERLRTAQEQLRVIEDETRRLQQQQRNEFERINDDEADAAAAIASHKAAEDQLTDQLADLLAEARRREEARRRREQQNSAPGNEGNGPLNWPTSGYVTQEYGCTGFSWEPPYGNCAHFHQGIDIANDNGTPIRAAAAGTVVFVGYNPYDRPGDAAWIVIIAHAGGLDSRYAHLQGRYADGVRAGRRVRQGQVIGWMGNTGYSTGVHLHWEVQRGGGTVNPRSYL